MARSKHCSILDRFLEQEKFPAFTALSLLTTISVWVVIVADLLHKPESWGGIAQLAILMWASMLGLMANVVFGLIATAREEYCGGRIAAIGIALWSLTILAIFRMRGNHIWP